MQRKLSDSLQAGWPSSESQVWWKGADIFVCDKRLLDWADSRTVMSYWSPTTQQWAHPYSVHCFVHLHNEGSLSCARAPTEVASMLVLSWGLGSSEQGVISHLWLVCFHTRSEAKAEVDQTNWKNCNVFKALPLGELCQNKYKKDNLLVNLSSFIHFLIYQFMWQGHCTLQSISSNAAALAKRLFFI